MAFDLDQVLGGAILKLYQAVPIVICFLVLSPITFDYKNPKQIRKGWWLAFLYPWALPFYWVSPYQMWMGDFTDLPTIMMLTVVGLFGFLITYKKHKSYIEKEGLSKDAI